jgi:hypothetical protein
MRMMLRTERLALATLLLLGAGIVPAGLWGGAAQESQEPRAETQAQAPEAEAAITLDPQDAAQAQEIVRRFAAKEKEFKLARDNYTYRQIVRVEDLSGEGDVVGTYEVHADIIFTPQGRRTEKVVYAPLSTLRNIGITPEDERDLRSIQPFVLTTDDLPKYDVIYQGRQKVDELTTFVFKVRPKKYEKGERYFEGLVWVDDRDLQIVKTFGKAVPDTRGAKGENLFPRFETYRQQIDGKYWFPVWTGADDTLYFDRGPQRIRMLVRYENYKQFKSETKITYGDEATQPPQLR